MNSLSPLSKDSSKSCSAASAFITAVSPSSMTAKSGSTSTSWKYLRIILKAKEWKVLMSASLILSSCLLRNAPSALPSSSSFSMAPMIFSFISEAAALVNVTTRILSISTFSSIMILLTLSTRTAVLPEPAAADTRRSAPLDSIASLCCSFQLTPMYFPSFLRPAAA